MSSINTISLFKDYMIEKKLSESVIEYNLKVVNLLYDNILIPLNKELDSIDVYAFEEFTDRIDILDNKLLGREGIELILDAMLILTEFLKFKKLIKGGKIAYYRRMFTNKDYYLDKYDSIKGKKDNVKEFIRKITKNKLSYLFTRLLDEINVYTFSTILEVESILDEEGSDEASTLLIHALENIKLIEKKGKRFIATKRGRALLRLEPEERYSGILYAFLYEVNWNSKGLSSNEFNINEFISVVCSIFNKEECICVDYSEIYDTEDIISFVKGSTRLQNLLKVDFNKKVFETIFINLGIIDRETANDKEIYTINEYGKNIIKLLYSENEVYMKSRVDKINFLIKNKSFNVLEKEIIKFIKIFGVNTIMLDYLGQILIVKKQYKEAYSILSYAYEISCKRGKVAKKALSHLIICCRKLQFYIEEEQYQKKYKLIQR
ncbi:hypothetical protein [Clostridium cylindrosporum]|uniref:Uncharacterized protein n=1 Tax=Clostridium cylindrosporum DSM 605 TaxID=1121307 RepID=A0A0J8G655_CLOCY|nr:hypothetical protein [Clostridium cylindrosporum]KMT23101.1 hypothetical protein CLCY_7c01480 [Clostridium cylindrosporum DSM 605]